MKRRGFFGVLVGLAIAGTARAQSSSASDLVRQITRGAPVGSGRVKLDIPRLADNGHSVPLEVTVTSPMTEADYVKSITLLSERNPRPMMAKFLLGPHSGRAEVSTRVRLNGTQRVIALAEFSDGSYWSATAEVEVTESACLDMS